MRRFWEHCVQATLLVVLALLAVPLVARAQSDPAMRAMNQPVPPFHLIGNIYYVGASDVTSFLIVTRAGDILLDGGFVQTAPQIEANIRKLGFKLSDVKILLNSHAHFDHAGGLAELKRRTGARFAAMEGDAALLGRGGRGDFYFGDRSTFPPIKVDRVLHDGDTVTLGGVTLTAHLTAGHTRGCTTWTMVTKDRGKQLHVVFVGSTSVLSGYRLVAKESYPGIAADYERSFRVLRSLPCDVFLGAHGQFFNLTAKREALAHSPERNPFIDPAGYRAYVDNAERAFQEALRKQQAISKRHESHVDKSAASARIASTACCAQAGLLEVAHFSSPSGSSQNEPPVNQRTADAVMKVEHEWLDALQRANVKKLEHILAAEFIDNYYRGQEVTRAEYLAYFAHGDVPPPPTSQRFEETKVRFIAGGNVAIVTGVVVTRSAAKSTAQSPSDKDAIHSRFTDILVWRDDRWQAVTAQETHFSVAR